MILDPPLPTWQPLSRFSPLSQCDRAWPENRRWRRAPKAAPHGGGRLMETRPAPRPARPMHRVLPTLRALLHKTTTEGFCCGEGEKKSGEWISWVWPASLHAVLWKWILGIVRCTHDHSTWLRAGSVPEDAVKNVLWRGLARAGRNQGSALGGLQQSQYLGTELRDRTGPESEDSLPGLSQRCYGPGSIFKGAGVDGGNSLAGHNALGKASPP